MAALTTQVMTTAGLAASYTAADGAGDTVSGTQVRAGGCFLHVKNGGGSSITVTVADPGKTPVGNTGTAPAVSVANGAEKFIPLYASHVDGTSDNVSISYSGVTSVTRAAIRG